MSKQIDLEKLRADAHRMAYVADQVRALEHKGSEADVYLTEAAQVFRDCAEVIAALEKDAARWKKVVHHVGADNFLNGAQFVIRGIPAPINVMRGSVAEHFTKAIDTAMEASNAKAD